jgi:prolipoprotein diacylglyceryltransferase
MASSIIVDPEVLKATWALPFVIIFGAIILAFVIFIFIFWIWMLLDAVQRKFKTDGEKIAWVLIIIFLHILGAIIYYFAVKNKDNDKGKKR